MTDAVLDETSLSSKRFQCGVEGSVQRVEFARKAKFSAIPVSCEALLRDLTKRSTF